MEGRSEEAGEFVRLLFASTLSLHSGTWMTGRIDIADSDALLWEF